MTEEAPKTSKTKVRIYNFTKLALAIGALTTAINGYIQIRKDQNNLLEVISDKVDAIVLKVAYLEGRIDGLTPKEAAKEAEKKIAPAPQPSEVTSPGHSEPQVPASAPTPSPAAPAELPAVAKANAQLYQQMPRNFEAVQMVVDEKILKVDGLAPAAPLEVKP